MSAEVNPVILTAKELKVHYGEQIILDKASLSIHQADRIGLVGRNGAGKSTFLKIISGIMQPDSGEVAKRKGLSTGILTQEFTLDNTKNVYENILIGAEKELKLIEKYESTPFDSREKHFLEEKLNQLDSWNIEKRIHVLIKSLNAPEPEREIAYLSGGEKRRVALCRAIISKPDLLILDEPTNHLDTESIEWIEDFLAAFAGTCIFVTHDRYFLDRIANRIVEISEGKFFSHSGNYTDYLINKTTREEIKEAEEKKRQNFLRRELEWVRHGPKARRTKSKSRLDNLYDTQNQEKSDTNLDVDLIIPETEQLGKKVLELKNVGIQLGEKTLFEHLNFDFTAGRKLGVVGRNGVGKTTLLNIILGKIKPTTGKVIHGERTEINYVDQSRLILNDEDTVFDAVGEGNESIKFGKRDINVWTYLRRFLFTDQRINTKVGRLSGGEKSRLTLARILRNGGNFLMLDEPTNDLDLPTLRILEEALVNYEGCVVVVSHDRYFLNRVCDGILAIEQEGSVYFSEGNYDYYLQKKKLRSKEIKPANENINKNEKRGTSKGRKLSYNEKKELENIEENIINAEEEVGRIENIFATPELYQEYEDRMVQLNDELEEARKRVRMLYNRWEELELIKKEVENNISGKN